MKDKRNNLVSGIYRSSDGNAVPVDNCKLQTAKTNEIFKTLCLLFKSFKVKPFDQRTKSGYLRSVTIREAFATGEIMVIISAVTPDFPAKRHSAQLLLESIPK